MSTDGKRHLPVIPDGWEIKRGVPPTRAECENGPRPCPWVNCRYHLWLVEGRDMPGRRYGSKTPPSELRPASPHTCALDITGPLSVKEIAERMGCSERRVQQLLKAVLQRPHVGDWVRRLHRLKEFIDG